MQETRRNVLVGTFVLVGLGVLATLIILFGQGPMMLRQGEYYPVVITFGNAAGIRSGTLVTLNGIEIGRVEQVGIAKPDDLTSGAVVRVSIENRYALPDGVYAVTTEPVLGQGRPPIEIKLDQVEPDAPKLVAGPDGLIEIKGEVLTAFDRIFPTRVVVTFEDAARQIGNSAEALTPVLQELQVLLEQRSPAEVDLAGGPQGNLSTAVARLDASLKNFNDVLGDPEIKSELREVVANMREVSRKGDRLVDTLQAAAEDGQSLLADARQVVRRTDQAVANADDHIAQVARSTRDTLGLMDEFLGHLNTVGAKVAAGEGNVGRLIMDNDLYDAMVFSAKRLALVLEDAQKLIAEWREGKIRVAF
jgi:phospholipid/cholesterol/gamma-HCH transport system substrate-binding protein